MEDELNQDEELTPSEIGTLEYWEKVYEEEINNFEDHGDVGEVWYGKRTTENIIKSINDKLDISKSDKIVDVGCGNGWSLVQFAKKGFTNLIGVDYSSKALDLAKAILIENEIDENIVKLMVCDILDTDKLKNPLDNNFKLVHDKGTYDAISLNCDNPKLSRQKYIKNVYDILLPSGYLTISSCNWTKDELIKHFNYYFNDIYTIHAPAMTFGGKTGSSVTTVFFQKKKI